jgi:hypothetical protein
MAKNYQRRCCVSSHPPQIRWPKVFGRVESLDWRGLRDTSRSDRCLSMTHQRGITTLRMLDLQRLLVARRRLQVTCRFTVKPERFVGAGGCNFAYNPSRWRHDARKSDHSPAVEQLERLPRSATAKVLPQPGHSRPVGSRTSSQAQRATICLTERLRDNFADAEAGSAGKSCLTGVPRDTLVGLVARQRSKVCPAGVPRNTFTRSALDDPPTWVTL